ncbi:MAG: hypothetical protein MK384_00210 [SAR202 cluster bacterium]|nr:hypothetical protein [SAR202 cluster bacterium]
MSTPVPALDNPLLQSLNLKVFARIITLIIILVYPLVFAGMYAGDAEIHLVYGESASKGHFFEFNPGEKSSGVTSIGYMMVVSALFKLFPSFYVPLVLKLINVAAWYALVGLVYLIARRLLTSEWWALAATSVSGLLPGSAYNSTIGMENGLFAAVIFGSIYLIIRWRWLDPDSQSGAGRDIVIGTCLAISASLRPEGLLLVPLIIGYRCWIMRGSILRPLVILSHGLTATPFVLIAGAMVLFHISQTGDVLPSSGLSRMVSSTRDAIYLGPFWFNPKFAERLVYYLPVTVFWLVGNAVILRTHMMQGIHTERLLVILFWTFFLLYSTVLGSAHLARYVIFLMPMFVLIATVGARWFWEHGPEIIRQNNALRWTGLAVGAIGISLIFAIETDIRRDLGAHDELIRAMRAPEQRTEFSDAMMTNLGNPTERPISLAYQEVQLRYWLDQRFVVRSLDGRVDKVMMDFVQDGTFDHIGYLKQRDVDFVVDLVNYNRDDTQWSLARLNSLDPGDVETRNGITFRKLDSGVIEVVYNP